MTANSLKGLHWKTDYYNDIDMNRPYSFSFNKTNDFYVLDNKVDGYLTKFEDNIHNCSIEQAEEFMQQLVDKIEQSSELRCEEFKFVPIYKGREVPLGDKSNGYRLTAHFIHPVFRENDNFYLSILLTDIIKSSRQIKSSFENFDEYPAQSIIKVWKKEKGYNVDTMNLFFDDYIYEDKWIPTKEIKNIEKEYREWLWNYCVENQIDIKQFRELDDTFGLYTPDKLLESSIQINSMAIKQIEKYYEDGLLTKREVIAILMKENGWDFPQAKQIADYYERVYINQSVVSGHQKNINSLNIIFNEKEI